MMQTANYENSTSISLVQDLLENRVDSLRALATLMLREVESMEKTVPAKAIDFEWKEFRLQNEIQRYEADLIRSALLKTQGRQRQAARLLGVKITTLNAKIKKYEINWRVIGIDSEFVS